MKGIAASVRGVLALALLAVPIVACPKWVTTQFEAYEGWPAEQPDWEAREAGKAGRELHPALVRDIENFLYAVARRLENMDFADPVAAGVLNSLVTLPGGEKAIRVYLYSDPGASSLASYRNPPPCNPPGTRSIIKINTATFGFLQKISDQDYSTLAHELFHSVQYASPNFKTEPCRRGKWIREGSADAIGFHMGRVLRNAQNLESVRRGLMIKEFGVRRYNYPLNHPNTKLSGGEVDDYATSSFWRHVAEMAYMHNEHQKPHPGSRPVEEDYGYLARFLNQPYAYGANPDGEIAWLNEMLKADEHVRAGLNDVYAQFVSTFADIINTRIGVTDILSAGERQEKWLGRVYGACDSVKLPAPPNAKGTVTVQLRPNSARCLAVSQSGPARSALTIQASHPDVTLLEQLRIAPIDGTMDGRPDIRSPVSGRGPHVARWVAPLFTPYTKYLVVTNVAAHPAGTRAFDPELQLSIGQWNSSMTYIPSGPQQPQTGPQQPFTGPLQPKPAAPQPGTVRATQRQQYQQAVSAALADPVNNLRPISKTARHAYDKPISCDPRSLEHNLCGSQLVVTLELSPLIADFNILDLQLGAELQGATLEGPAGRPGIGSPMLDSAAAQDLERHLQSTDGNRIVLRMPKIEYGFAGELGNVEIEVSRAGGGHYLSYGPEVDYGQQIVHRPRTGRVMIDEYTPTLLAGRFTADLVDLSNPGKDEAPIIARQIEGSFLVPAPLQGDEGFEPDLDNAKEAALRAMLQNAPWASGVIQGIIESTGGKPPQIMCDEGIEEEFLLAMGFTEGCRSGGGSVEETCYCDCDRREEEEALPICERQCGELWNQCPLPQEVAQGDIEAQVAHCHELMLKKGVPEGQIPLLLDGFRTAHPMIREQMLREWCR